MAVNIKDLKNGGRVRETITYQGEVIKVFEPSKEVIEEIFRMQEKFMNDEDISEIEISGKDMILLFSKLTDIEGLDDLSDEELQSIIDDPTPAFLMVQHAVEGIATEIYKMVILSAKNRLMEQDFNVKASGVMNDMFAQATAFASQNKDYAEKMKKIQSATEKVEEAKKQAKSSNVTKMPTKPAKKKDVGSHGQRKVSKTRAEQKALLAEFEAEFSEKE